MPDKWNKVQAMCSNCHGTGKVIPLYDEGQPIPEEIDCPICQGKKYLDWGRMKEPEE